jgi:hypothetical protein
MICCALALACEPGGNGQGTDSQTNWLQSCQIDEQCGGGLSCVCGVCTAVCGEDAACASLPGATCVAASDPGAIARCGGVQPTSAGMCLPRCEDSSCPEGQMCVANVCEPVPEPKERVIVDSSIERQELIGFGASIAYGEAELTNHPRAAALFDAAFGGLGLDVLRFRNRYQYTGTGTDDLGPTGTLVAAARDRIGHEPVVLLSSWSPPAALKASGAVDCQGNPGTCTLIKNAQGAFDYAGFATFWRESLDAYAEAGIVPDYIGIQNNVDWVPTAQEVGAACKFLPVEGTATVTVAGSEVEIEYPGYAEALQATLAALEGIASMPKVLAPETSGFEAVTDYMPDLDFAEVDALAHHLYGVDPEAVDTTALKALGDFGNEYARPILQTEMQSDGYGTAVLIHHTLEIEGGSAYIQTTLTSAISAQLRNLQALIGLDESDFELQAPYYAMQHYAAHTDPGWVRLGSESFLPGVLATAWRSPDSTQLTIVLLNTTGEALDVRVDPGRDYATSNIWRTVFSGVERHASLGLLSRERIVHMPGRSIVTVSLAD